MSREAGPEARTTTTPGGDRTTALYVRGAAMVVGDGETQDPEAAVSLLTRAAGAGDGEAAALCAVLAGLGLGRPQSWEDALDLLQLAAELGNGAAKGQIGVLALDPQLALAPRPGAARLARARRRIDLEAWTTPPSAAQVSVEPRILMAQGFAPAAACRWLRARAKARLAPALVNDVQAGRSQANAMRTNTAAALGVLDTDVVALLLQAKLAALTGLPTSTFEPPNVLHYKAGQAFETHVDFIDPAVPHFREELALFGQRAATALVWLNDGYSGGETEFPSLGRKFRGAMGDAMVFYNVDGAGRPDRRTVHAGLPPVRGEKWVLSQWIRDRVQPIS